MKPITTGVLLMGDLSAEDLASLARQVEDWGYDYIWLADERFFREIYSCLTLCALNTKKIQIGVCVTDPYSRHPALTAMAIATLDEISEGRAVLGIGAGVSGFGELGIDRARPALAMREMVGLVRKLMTGENVDFQGRMVQFNHGALNFTPVRADLPIYVASNAPRGPSGCRGTGRRRHHFGLRGGTFSRLRQRINSQGDPKGRAGSRRD